MLYGVLRAGWIGKVDHSGKSSALSSDPPNKPQQGQLLKLHFGEI